MGQDVKQWIVVRRDLDMGPGRVAAMVAHAAISFLANRLKPLGTTKTGNTIMGVTITPQEEKWLTEMQYEDVQQLGFTKVVLAAENENHLRYIWAVAARNGLCVQPVYDAHVSRWSDQSLACIAIGPDEPSRVRPAVEALELY